MSKAPPKGDGAFAKAQVSNTRLRPVRLRDPMGALMQVFLVDRYTLTELEMELARVLRILQANQVAEVEHLEIKFRAIDLDGFETFPADADGQHAGFSIAKPSDEVASARGHRAVGWHFPWISDADWP